MFHACLYTICFVFCYTSWCFYAFSRTNLLMRCHSASFLFFSVFVFQKSYTIFSELYETKAEVPIFPDTRWSPKQRRRGTRGRPHHRVARASPWPRHQVVGPPDPPPDAALPPIYSPRQENLKDPINFPWNIRQSTAIVDARLGGSRSSSWHPCRRGESPPEAFFITMPASGVICE
jgi:hypothetical protein